MTRKWIRNAVRCKHCLDVIESKHTHDFRRCKCGAVAVDGGLDHVSRTVNQPWEDHMEELSEWEEEQ